MKVLKGLGTIILAIMLVILITLLSLSMVFRNVLQKDVIISALKQEIRNDYENELNSFQKESMDKILNDKSVNKIVDNIIDDFIDYAEDKNNGVTKKTIDSIVGFVLEHKDSIEAINETKIDVEELTSDKSLKELENILNEAFNDLLDSTDRNTVKTISYLFTKQFKVSVMISIVVIIILLMLISWSYYKWLLTFGISSIISGAFVLTLYIILKLLLGAIVNDDIVINIDPVIALVVGIVEIMVGILAIIVKNKIDRE